MAGQLECIRQATPEAEALAAMCRLLETGHPLVVAYSGGKDSSVLANLALHAALTVRASLMRVPPIVVVHADVGSVENPEIRALVNGELAKKESFARRLGIDLLLRIARPPLSETFAVRVVGGRGLPAFPDSRRDCTSSWKSEPNDRALRALLKEFPCQGWAELVVMTGVRRDESTVRAGAILARGEQSVRTWTDSEGRLRLSPCSTGRAMTCGPIWACAGRARWPLTVTSTRRYASTGTPAAAVVSWWPTPKWKSTPSPAPAASAAGPARQFGRIVRCTI